MSKHTGWEQEYRTHFDSIVNEYEAIRPEWVKDIYDDINEYAKQAEHPKAIEIGVGTGKATAPILALGYDVTAIEINPKMAEFAANKFKENDKFNVKISSFEDVELKGDTYDLIYAALAFHWVNAKIGLPKAMNLLKENGVIALFRYNEVASPENELYNKIIEIHHKYYDTYFEVPYYTPKRKKHEDFLTLEEIYKGFRFESLEAYGFRDVTMKFYDVSLEYTADEYITLLNTLSDHRKLPDSVRVPFYKELTEAIGNYGGVYKIDYVFQLYLGRK